MCQAESDRVRKASDEVKFKNRVTKVRSKYKVRPALAAALSVIHYCEACGKKQTRPGEMHIDHCHTTGQVRGVLCFNCNVALGNVGDSIDRLYALVAYLKTKHAFQSLDDLKKAKHYIDMLIELENRT